MKVSDKGLDFIKSFEGLSLSAYPDPGTGGEPFTIGYGRAHGVKENDTCTEEEALQWLRDDLSEAESCVSAQVDVELTQDQFDALCSFVYNAGCLAFRNSTMLRLINAGNFAAVPAQLLRWNHAGGVVMAGLTRRRKAEADLFALA